MKHLVSVCAAGAIICVLAAFGGTVSLFNISWSNIIYLVLGGVVFTIGLVFFHERNKLR